MYVCICKQVTDKQIKTAIEDGATSMRELRNELGVASQCGQCGSCAKTMLKEHATDSVTRLPLPKRIPSPVSTDVFPLFGDAMLASD